MLTAMDYVESLLDLVGNTPLLRFTARSTSPRTARRAARSVLAKIEYLNPAAP